MQSFNYFKYDDTNKLRRLLKKLSNCPVQNHPFVAIGLIANDTKGVEKITHFKWQGSPPRL
jgi:hypothetical protein